MKGKILILLLIIFIAISGFRINTKSKLEDFTITIIRTSYNANSVTGELFANGNFICHTLELPWQNNQSYISSIPSGKYKAILRYDKNDKWRIQLENVPKRSGVQIHIGNYPSQIEGCVLVGDEVFNADNKIEKSSNAYLRLKSAFYGTSDPITTPDVNIYVEVKYTPERTKLINNQGTIWQHADQNLWLYGSEKLENYEYKRDLNFIYIKYRGPNFFFRFPIHGGISEYSSSKNGPWEKGDSDSDFRREN